MKIFQILLVCFICSSAIAQQTAVTTDGDTVYLYDNGMWSYDNEIEEPKVINFLEKYTVSDSSLTTYTIPSSSVKEFGKEENYYNLFVDDEVWQRVPNGTVNLDADYCFNTRKQTSCYAMIINEGANLGLLPLFNIAMENARVGIGTEPNVIHTDYVLVNGKQMIKAEYQLNASGLDITFISLFYSDNNGSTQYTTWTSSNLLELKRPELEGILSGLLIKE